MNEINESQEAPKPEPTKDNLDMAKIEGAMKGNEAKTAAGDKGDTTEPSFIIKMKDGEEIPLNQGIDPSKMRYETRSPHKDYENYKDMVAAKQQHELGQQAATATSLPDAINTTIAARKEAQDKGETPMDELFYLKHGRTSYTSDAYPKLTAEDQPKSVTDEDILLDELEKLREQQDKELQEDLEKFKNRPKPPYIQD